MPIRNDQQTINDIFLILVNYNSINFAGLFRGEDKLLSLSIERRDWLTVSFGSSVKHWCAIKQLFWNFFDVVENKHSHKINDRILLITIKEKCFHELLFQWHNWYKGVIIIIEVVIVFNLNNCGMVNIIIIVVCFICDFSWNNQVFSDFCSNRQNMLILPVSNSIWYILMANLITRKIKKPL